MGFFDWLRRALSGPDPGAAQRQPRPVPPQLPPATQRPVARPNPMPPAPSKPARPAPPPPPAPPPRPIARTAADLDLGRFAPISKEEMDKRAKETGPRWSNAFWGRRDLIPPVEDPRTLLIDKGMVGYGLLTPEALVEIHEAGRRMDEIRPDRIVGVATAEAKAVLEDKAAREEHRRVKQAEAAEKKRRHEEGVAHRKATDIVFLGRGVSKGLADRRADVEKLGWSNLPVLATPADVASALGIEIKRLRWLAFHQDAAVRTHYVRFEVPKKSGGVRTLASPRKSLRAAQTWILRNVLDVVAPHAAAHGFVKDRSILTNARPHVGRDVVLNMDLTDFFGTVTFPRVRGLFQQLGYSPAAATILALLATESPRRIATLDGTEYHVATGPRALPQGACTSPAISNLVARRLDSRLSGLATKLGFTYTRYADDLSFSASGDAARHVGRLAGAVRRIVVDEGFAVNEKKTRTQRRSASQRVTGIVVNDRPAVPRATVRRLRAILHRARREGLAAQNCEGRPEFEAWLRGMIAYVEMVDPARGGKFRAEMAALSA